MKIRLFFGAMMAAIGTSFAQVGTNTLANNLVAYYPLQGNANDSSGNGNNGVPSNITYGTNRFGITNSAAFFGYLSGASWVNFGNMGNILCTNLNSLKNYPITYSLWCKLDAYQAWLSGNGSGVMTIIGREGSGYTDAAIAILTKPDQMATNKLSYLGSSWNPSGFTPDLNQWFHIVLTISDAGLQTFYVNGTQLFQTNSPTAQQASAEIPFRIGASSSYGSPNANRIPFQGYISDVGIWSRAMSSNEVAALYTQESTYFPYVSDGVFATITHKRPVISPTASTGYFCEAYKI